MDINPTGSDWLGCSGFVLFLLNYCHHERKRRICCFIHRRSSLLEEVLVERRCWWRGGFATFIGVSGEVLPPSAVSAAAADALTMAAWWGGCWRGSDCYRKREGEVGQQPQEEVGE
jgi:hypothetical protein